MNVMSILAAKGSDVLTLKLGQTIGDAVSILADRNIGALVVVDEFGHAAGIISERDVVRKLMTHAEGLLKQPITDCMTPNPYTLGPEASLDEVMSMMTKHRIRHLPIEEKRKLVGIISIGDVVKRKIAETEAEREALKEYIAG